jgi:hypothetical protein
MVVKATSGASTLVPHATATAQASASSVLRSAAQLPRIGCWSIGCTCEGCLRVDGSRRGSNERDGLLSLRMCFRSGLSRRYGDAVRTA